MTVIKKRIVTIDDDVPKERNLELLALLVLLIGAIVFVLLTFTNIIPS